jgi:hypothetical protein
MDVNNGELSGMEFKELSGVCSNRKDWQCLKTHGYACKDYLCPIVKAAKNIEEIREVFLKQY